jgi:CDP-glucose 4,6-dehydratase
MPEAMLASAGSTEHGRQPDPAFWAGKRVLVTGHTGFKGAWAVQWLNAMGAEVFGLALEPEGPMSLYAGAKLDETCTSMICDIRDASATAHAVELAKPDLVLHMAAQALVRRSYRDPLGTYATNVMGTAHLLEALRAARSTPNVCLVVTSDKVYLNDESGRAFVERDELGGHDPYAASKAACEVVVASYRDSYLRQAGMKLATARGGNVIGGGDFAEDRIVPDIWRAAQAGTALQLRSPHAVRPWQHVLDCLSGYLCYLEDLALVAGAPTCLNIGPDPGQSITVGQLALAIQTSMGLAELDDKGAEGEPHEMKTLCLDPSLAHATLGWRERLAGTLAMEWTGWWYGQVRSGMPMKEACEAQISRFTEQGERVR